ncbi:MAG: hypothetical protein RL477_491 [Pseudomonadota bacterium]|jgi:hypothetical protein
MAQYWVVGGEYDSTRFQHIAGGRKPFRAGPFGTYEDALRKWAELAWQTVDTCNVRFHIETDHSEADKDKIRAA